MSGLPDNRNVLAWMVLPLRRYAQFIGRSGRREFWFYSLFLVLGYLAIFCLTLVAAIVRSDPADDFVGWMIVGGWGLFFLANFVPGLALTVRRLHDMNLSGVLLVAICAALLFLNVLGWIAYLVVMSLPPRPGPNRHGPPVQDKDMAEVFA